MQEMRCRQRDWATIRRKLRDASMSLLMAVAAVRERRNWPCRGACNGPCRRLGDGLESVKKADQVAAVAEAIQLGICRIGRGYL